MAIISTQLLDLERCPQCGIASPLLMYQDCFRCTPADGRHDIQKYWVIYRCESCGDLVGAKGRIPISHFSQVTNYLANYPDEALEVLPEPISVDQHLPARPRTYLAQAINSMHAPDGAVMLAGSAIDAMLKLRGLNQGTVYQRIEKAVETSILTKEMSDWAHAVRLESNKPRHADLDEPHATREQALRVIDFAKALGDFLFVFPARVAAGLEAAKATEEA